MQIYFIMIDVCAVIKQNFIDSPSINESCFTGSHLPVVVTERSMSIHHTHQVQRRRGRNHLNDCTSLLLSARGQRMQTLSLSCSELWSVLEATVKGASYSRTAELCSVALSNCLTTDGRLPRYLQNKTHSCFNVSSRHQIRLASLIRTTSSAWKKVNGCGTLKYQNKLLLNLSIVLTQHTCTQAMEWITWRYFPALQHLHSMD